MIKRILSSFEAKFGKKRRSVYVYSIVLLSTLLLISTTSYATDTSPKNQKPIKLSGQTSFELRYDKVYGKEQYIPVWIERLTLTPILTLYGYNLPFSIVISSEESSFRQPFNRFELHLKRKWIAVRLGDTHPVFSKYSLNGILVRGGSVVLGSSALRFSVAGGQTKRAIEGTGGRGTFGQWLLAAKIGSGTKMGSNWGLSFVKVKDDANSISSPGTKTPRENALLSFDGGLKLFNKKVDLGGEFALSVFTGDLRSSELEELNIPTLAKKVITPRISTMIDGAFDIRLRTRLPNLSLAATYKHIGAGFNSLGTPYLRNDERGFTLVGRSSLIQNKVGISINYDRFNDNLANIKKFTTTRSTAGFNLSLMGLTPRTPTSFNFGYRVVGRKNDALTDLEKTNTSTGMLILSSGVRFKWLEMDHALGGTFSHQSYRDRNPTHPVSDFDVQTAMLSLANKLKIPVTLSWMIGLTRNYKRADNLKTNIWLYKLGVTHRAFNNRLTSYANLGLDSGTDNLERVDTDRLSFGIGSSYAWTVQSLSASLRRAEFKDHKDASKDYHELKASFSYTRRF